MSTAKRANESVWNWKKGAFCRCVGTPYSLFSREAVPISSSIRPSVVLVIRLSTSTRARMAARAASGSRKVAANPSRASYQSWLPGIA